MFPSSLFIISIPTWNGCCGYTPSPEVSVGESFQVLLQWIPQLETEMGGWTAFQPLSEYFSAFSVFSLGSLRTVFFHKIMKINLKLLKIFLSLLENVTLFHFKFPLSVWIEWVLIVIYLYLGNRFKFPFFQSFMMSCSARNFPFRPNAPLIFFAFPPYLATFNSLTTPCPKFRY